jgi:hypothetical protein
MRARRLLWPVVVSGLVVALLSGCTGSDDPPESEDPTGGESSSETEPAGPSPEELSAQVLDAADASASGATPLGSGTGTVASGEDLTIDVLSIDRVDEATLVTMRVTAATTSVIGPFDMNTARHSGQNFARALFLEDAAVTKTRYLPLQFADFRDDACICPYIPLEVGTEPQTLTALYPVLPPEVTTVSLRAGDSSLVVEGLPVGG